MDGAQVAHDGEGEAGKTRKHAIVVEGGADESAGLGKKRRELLLRQSAGASHDPRSGGGPLANIEWAGPRFRALTDPLSLATGPTRAPLSFLARRPMILSFPPLA